MTTAYILRLSLIDLSFCFVLMFNNVAKLDRNLCGIPHHTLKNADNNLQSKCLQENFQTSYNVS